MGVGGKEAAHAALRDLNEAAYRAQREARAAGLDTAPGLQKLCLQIDDLVDGRLPAKSDDLARIAERAMLPSGPITHEEFDQAAASLMAKARNDRVNGALRRAATALRESLIEAESAQDPRRDRIAGYSGYINLILGD